jgi:hypothetical protein
MARRQAEDTRGKTVTTSRRSLLKLAGAAVATAGLSGMTPEVSAATTVNLGDEGLSPGDSIDSYLEDYFTDGNRVVVPEGEYEWDGDGIGGSYADAAIVGDGPVVFRHPDGMHRAPTTRATGGTVAFRNVTIRGECDGDDSRWRLEADDDADLVLENVALPDGMEGQFGDATGIYVPPGHAGTLTLRNVHLEDFSNNGLYASAPGKPSDGQQGAVLVEGGLYKNNNVAGVRLGSDGSHAIGVTIVNDAESTDIGGPGTAQRGLRIREPGDDIVVEDCDIYHSWEGAASPVQFHPGAEGGSGVIRNTRVLNNSGATAVTDSAADGWTAEGLSITGDGDLSYPSSFSDVCVGGDCAAADPEPSNGSSSGGGTGDGSTDDGSSGNGSGGDGSSGDGSNDGSADGDLFIVEAVEAGPKFAYEFTATGPVTKVQDGSRLDAESNDAITDNGDGSYTVTGETGNGFGDSFRVDGEFAGFSADTDAANYTLLLGGDEVSPDMLGSTDGGSDGGDGSTGTRLEVVAVEAGPKFSYEFVTEGAPAKVQAGTRLDAEGNDAITDNGDGSYTVTGETGNGFGDSYDLSGEVTSFSTTTDASNVVLRYDGSEVTVDELVADRSLPNTISFDGMGTDASATYRFEVDGEVAAGSGGSVEDADSLGGTVVEGSVTGDTDSYRFSGDLVAFELEGAALVDIEVTE